MDGAILVTTDDADLVRIEGGWPGILPSGRAGSRSGANTRDSRACACRCGSSPRVGQDRRDLDVRHDVRVRGDQRTDAYAEQRGKVTVGLCMRVVG